MPPLFEETAGRRLVLLDRYCIKAGRVLAPAAIVETWGWGIVTVRLPLRFVVANRLEIVRGRVLHFRPELREERWQLGDVVELEELSRLPPVDFD